MPGHFYQRSNKDGLQFCVKWAMEDQHLTPTERTKRVLAGTMVGIEHFLDFTYETSEDEGFNGWLPTLDTQMRIEEDNTVGYRYYEKDTCNKRTIQSRTAMNENTKMQILSNDTVRRLLTTREDLGDAYKGAVVDRYAVKLLRSGYKREQVRKILKNGIKGYIGWMRSRLKAGRKLGRVGIPDTWGSYLTRLVGTEREGGQEKQLVLRTTDLVNKEMRTRKSRTAQKGEEDKNTRQ